MTQQEDVETRPAQRFGRLPALPEWLAAGITGLLCGVLGALLVWGGERGCDAVRGRPTCGGYGLPMLLLIVAACFVLGVFLLRALQVSDPGVTTFFGLALPLLIILGLLLDYVFDTWMAFGMPLIAAVCFVISTYLARAFEAANPSAYADDPTTPSPPARTRRAERTTEGQEADVQKTDVQSHDDDLPRYAPRDTPDPST